MLNVERTRASVITCLASPSTLDTLAAPSGTFACRVAPDELWLVTAPSRGDAARRQAIEHLTVAEPSGLVLDQSDGWSMFTLRGTDAPSLLAQLSVLPLPNGGTGFTQGAVAGGPAKILLSQGTLHVIVPSTLRDYVGGRLRDVLAGRTSIANDDVDFACDSTPTIQPSGAAASVPR
ncbi:MAG: hypothetical protein U0132_17680 [Gemmatimonadaceae bacterium]